MVPNRKDVGGLDLIGLAREGRATPADLANGTISITNIGVFGVDGGTAILNPGEAAILRLGAVRGQPWVHQGELAVRWATTLSLSFDHRLVDGEDWWTANRGHASSPTSPALWRRADQPVNTHR
jgi:pyruvate dehydrogenase E2 component (dihydrolipoamide acetyltransferase)